MARKRPTLIHYLEAIGAVIIYFFFRALPVDWASGLGGFAARMIGPRLGITKRARENLRIALPALDDAESRRILRDMWDNLGRVCAEYPHLRNFTIANGRIIVEDQGNILPARDPKQRHIFFSAHCGNWEVTVRAAIQLGFEVTAVYRAANNPVVDRLIAWARGAEGGEFVPKGSAAAHRVFPALREGRELCMLIDQKMNDGIAVPFFGRPVMTAPALALLAQRLNCAVVPAHVVRLKGARFRVILEPPIDLPKNDGAADRLQLMTTVNQIVERWIRERPEQWLWLHRRWPD